ncbi:MAG: hypothetical protein HRU19_13330 [Pseudobacteriovorax sp.]|nr:hypothetical protein [Pseudobacteriovorax sp.]
MPLIYRPNCNLILQALSVMMAGLLSLPVSSTPLIALREADNCAGCHTPGRSQRPLMERRCTLDCQGCHVDPAGEGPRNQWGKYYSLDQASLVNFMKPEDPLKDLSRFDLHMDTRVIHWDRAGGDRQTFPMAFEPAIRIRPFINYLHLTYELQFLGRPEDNKFRVVNEGDRRYREKYSIMIDALPFNTYVRAYRGTPMYGLKRPNHTLWIRQRIGLDQFATTEAFEIGGTPNVPFFRVSQMSGDPYVDKPFRQKGSSMHGGVRGVTLGWHLNGSYWDTESDYHKIKMKAFGAGLNVFNTIWYSEKNWRNVSAKTSEVIPVYVHPGSTIEEHSIAFAQITGFTAGLMQETLEDDDRDSQRRSIFVDIHPVPGLQLELWRRMETGTRTATDTLGVIHFYVDW